MVRLGSYGTDNVTGFAGLVVVRADHLHGCIHIGLEPTELRDGKPMAIEYFDEQRIVVDNAKEVRAAIAPTSTPVEPGWTVADSVTGHTGIVVVRSVHLYGQAEICVQPQSVKDDKLAPSFWLPEARANVLKRNEPEVSADSSAPNGFVITSRSGSR